MLVENLELAGLILCQLLTLGLWIWTVIDGGFFEAKPKIVDLGRIENENGKIKRLYSAAGTGSFQGVVQGQGDKSVTGFDRVAPHFQCDPAEGEAAGAGTTGQESGRGIEASTLCRCEAKRSRYDKRSQEESELDDGGLRELLERRAIECGLFGSRVNND